MTHMSGYYVDSSPQRTAMIGSLMAWDVMLKTDAGILCAAGGEP